MSVLPETADEERASSLRESSSTSGAAHGAQEDEDMHEGFEEGEALLQNDTTARQAGPQANTATSQQLRMSIIAVLCTLAVTVMLVLGYSRNQSPSITPKPTPFSAHEPPNDASEKTIDSEMSVGVLEGGSPCPLVPSELRASTSRKLCLTLCLSRTQGNTAIPASASRDFSVDVIQSFAPNVHPRDSWRTLVRYIPASWRITFYSELRPEPFSQCIEGTDFNPPRFVKQAALLANLSQYNKVTRIGIRKNQFKFLVDEISTADIIAFGDTHACIHKLLLPRPRLPDDV